MKTSPLTKPCHRSCLIFTSLFQLFWDFNLEIYFHRNIIQIMFAKVWSCWNFFHFEKTRETSFSFYWKSNFNQVSQNFEIESVYFMAVAPMNFLLISRKSHYEQVIKFLLILFPGHFYVVSSTNANFLSNRLPLQLESNRVESRRRENGKINCNETVQKCVGLMVQQN